MVLHGICSFHSLWINQHTIISCPKQSMGIHRCFFSQISITGDGSAFLSMGNVGIDATSNKFDRCNSTHGNGASGYVESENPCSYRLNCHSTGSAANTGMSILCKTKEDLDFLSNSVFACSPNLEGDYGSVRLTSSTKTILKDTNFSFSTIKYSGTSFVSLENTGTQIASYNNFYRSRCKIVQNSWSGTHQISQENLVESEDVARDQGIFHVSDANVTLTDIIMVRNNFNRPFAINMRTSTFSYSNVVSFQDEFSSGTSLVEVGSMPTTYVVGGAGLCDITPGFSHFKMKARYTVCVVIPGICI